MPIRKVLVANRGEIAVRVIRAARDAGIASVAVYADPDAASLFVRLADEAFALNGMTPADSYLDIAKILALAERSGADSVHPGYGFLAENADFARAVIDAGLTWIGPGPQAIDALGDKVQARHIAQQVGAPLVPGTADPVSGAAEVVAFAQQYGLPIAIKAAFGGGGRGLKVVRDMDDIEELYASATREAVTAFGRGECFVERYLDRPRHVETQCLADTHGNVVVVTTRDCSLQRRHQKLLEEAPAPFLSDAQRESLYESSKAILRQAGYVGAGTCEFLIGLDGTISFLEVNTRLQVEHPVSEEVTGVDLVEQMFRIANGEALGFTDPPSHGHAIEFRINAEDPRRRFMPAPGTLTAWKPPTGPGVRVDEGYQAGMAVPGSFDSLVAKIIVTGADRAQAIARAKRALGETVLEGMPSVIPFHKAVLEEPDFVAADGNFKVHTRWIETEFSTPLPPYLGELGEAEDSSNVSYVVEVNGRRMEVRLPSALSMPVAKAPVKRPTKRSTGGVKAKAPASNVLTAPMQGTVVKVAVLEGDLVTEGDLVVVLEAMKMEQPINAHRSGVIAKLTATGGATVSSGEALCEIADLPDAAVQSDQGEDKT
ncbi:MAG: ATP-grasp domain-containing protein [Propionibacteriaceae bacterium]|jgi:acetyl-CoA/propionyl-CoA carboxylase biotin carboxyl carrier protein|nr:ATP-grasp domain-containing protein [Propionibacteriaceae bacterium]